MIVPENVRAFWKARGNRCSTVPFESIGNLEESEELLALKIRLETECVFSILSLTRDMTVLDLGAGCGQWSFRFSPLVEKVVAVEYSEGMHAIGVAEAEKRNVKNIQFVHCDAEKYTSDMEFDVVFISGLFVYLTDEQSDSLLRNLPSLVKSDGVVFLRDGTSILDQRYHIDNRFSELLQCNYSALYRTRREYIELFRKAGLICSADGQVFEEGCALNKYPETRLRYYIFHKAL